jgi:rhodanese-related sulfurtransferase
VYVALSATIAHDFGGFRRIDPVSPLDALFEELSGHDEVLALGSGHSVVAAELHGRGTTVDAVSGDWPSIQLTRRYSLVIVEPTDGSEDVAAVVHCAAQHVAPAGEIVLLARGGNDAADRFDLREVGRFPVEGSEIIRYRRPDRVTIHDRVFVARTRIARVTPHDLAARLRRDGAPTVVDTRTATDRGRFGVIAGSIHVPRTLVEWHLDPANGYRHADVSSFDQPLVLVCNGGYSSSLAADSLLDLGFTDVGDLVGGIRAWINAGLEVVEPDHSHLDI